jgi:hypothetical protein
MVTLAIWGLLGCWIEDQAWAQVKAVPKMVIGEQSHDFKEVLEGDVIEHEFTILNHDRGCKARLRLLGGRF